MTYEELVGSQLLLHDEVGSVEDHYENMPQSSIYYLPKPQSATDAPRHSVATSSTQANGAAEKVKQWVSRAYNIFFD